MSVRSCQLAGQVTIIFHEQLPYTVAAAQLDLAKLTCPMLGQRTCIKACAMPVAAHAKLELQRASARQSVPCSALKRSHSSTAAHLQRLPQLCAESCMGGSALLQAAFAWPQSTWVSAAQGTRKLQRTALTPVLPVDKKRALVEGWS